MNAFFIGPPTDDSQHEQGGQYRESIENFHEPHMEESLMQGEEFLDDAIRMTDQDFTRNKIIRRASH